MQMPKRKSLTAGILLVPSVELTGTQGLIVTLCVGEFEDGFVFLLKIVTQG